jgi:L-amino acid N-acyltransferase YncA
MTTLDARQRSPELSIEQSETYAAWFSCLSDPTRVRALSAIATAAGGSIRVGDLARRLDISQSTCSHHVSRLADVGFVTVDKVGRTSEVRVNVACCTGLPHAADVVMGALRPMPCCAEDLPDDVDTREMTGEDMEAVRRIYAAGIATGNATFETEVPTADVLLSKWIPGHRWVATIGADVVGWAAVSPVSARPCYAGVGETSVYVDESARGRRVGTALVHRQVTEADRGGLWTLQTSIFPENRASLRLHHSAGFRTLAVRERIARLDGSWRDTVFLERRSQADGPA